MEYKQIYRETKVNPPDPGERADRFFTLTLYEALGDYQAPLLLKVESGNPQLEDWDRHWEIVAMPRNQAIREVIKRLDTHVFEEKE